MKVIGAAGFARSGKDTFVSIAKYILEKNGIRAKQYSFAKVLKMELEPFVRDVCKSDIWTADIETKTDMRDLMVWYGTTWWRKRDPKRWIRHVDAAIKSDINEVDVALVSDVRYPNEGEWVHSCQGFLVHLSKYWNRSGMQYDSFTGLETENKTWKQYDDAPNEQERINDPLVKSQSDYKLEWQAKGLTSEEAFNDQELRTEVLKALNSVSDFNGMLWL